MRNRMKYSVLLVIVSAGISMSSQLARTQSSSCLVSAIGGSIQGVDNGTSCAFLGIRFVAPPVGNLRWRPPQPAAAWAPDTLNATATGPACPQINPAGSTTVTGNEDCLRLHIWTPDPAPSEPVPVIVWIHPGAFQAASASVPDSIPRKLVEQTGVIVVAANYRYGPLGFLGHPALTAEDPAYPSSGNYGLLDQRAALAWVRDNIAAFGGDPENVTIHGQSAGAHSVSLHVVSPRSAGFFARAIMQSGYASQRMPTLADVESLGTDFAATVGCTDPAQVLECMRSKTRNEVLLAFGNGSQEFTESGRVAWSPVVDGLEIPDQPRRLYERGAFNRVPIIIGATRDEGWIYVDRSFPAGLTTEDYEAAVATEFGAAEAPNILGRYPVADYPTPKHALSQVTGDAEMLCEARRVARLVARTRTPVYLYSFEREAAAVAADQVIHGLDRNFVFGNNFGAPSNYVLNEDDLALFGAISSYWTRFAATGSPNDRDSGLPRWPAFKRPNGSGPGAGKYIVLDWPLGEAARLSDERCDYWDQFFLESIVSSVPASHPADDLCGVTITDDLKLDHDLACPGNGLIVGADRTRIDLNGHTIRGSGTGFGISISNRSHISVFGGTIAGFAAGVQVADSTDVAIMRNSFAGNVDGVDLQSGSLGIAIKDNVFSDNASRGIMMRGNSASNLVKENAFTGNRVGVLLFGTVDSIVRDNLVSESVLAGIRFNVLATRNLIKDNWITENPAGIEFVVTPTGSATGNSIVSNGISANACGVKGPAAGNTIARNIFASNVTDSCQ